MDLAFNELSFLPLTDSYALLDEVRTLLKTYREAKKRFGYQHIVFPANYAQTKVTKNQNLMKWIESAPPFDKSLLLSVIRKPFVDSYLSEDEQDEILEFYMELPELNIEQEYCDGLATACIREIPAISLANHEIWKRPMLRIKKENEISETFTILNLSNDPEEPDFVAFSQDRMEVNLIDSGLKPFDKPINIRHDHGEDILNDFAKRLIRHRYVKGIRNSLPFNPKIKRFIKGVTSDGLIEVVLYWEDSGIGLLVETTGRNRRETEEIAKILEDKFER